MPTRDLDVDPAGVHAAGATAGAAARSAPAAEITVTACAADATSVQVASRLAGRIRALNIATASANLKTGTAAARMHRDADTYTSRDAANASALHGDSSAGVSAAPPTHPAPARALPVAPPMPGAPAGAVPGTGREISVLMHSGPGVQGLQVTASLLNAQADRLDQAADAVAAARVGGAQSWQSAAADAAATHLLMLQAAYAGQAAQARSLSRAALAQADNFQRAKAAIPEPQVFADLEQRLHAAYLANAHPTSLGRYEPVIAGLQHDLAGVHQVAVREYAHYQRSAAGDFATIEWEPEPPAGSAPASDDEHDPGGAGGEDDTDHPGHDTQTQDPAALPVAGPAVLGGETATALTQMVLPAVLGAVSGAAGEMLGVLSGAGAQLRQAGSQLAGGLAQGVGTAMTSAMGAGKFSGDAGPDGAMGSPSSGGFGDPGLGGGGEPGGTEPASGGGAAGALSAPAGASAAPAAAPATLSAPVAPVSGATTAAPLGGGMIPPMMPIAGRPGAGGAEEDRRLYLQRRMRIETPPNTEPVKGRREARRPAGGKAGEGDAGQ